MNEDVVAVFIPITAIVMSLGIPIIYQILDYRRRRDVVEAHHKERMAAIERGMDLPALPEAFYSPLDRNKRPRHLLTGMIWFFIGVALFLALGAVAGEDVRFFGLIPTGIGLAFLIYYFIEGKHEVEAFKAKEAARDAAAPKA
jgi:Domain of unknown function (DUF6249)